MATWKKFLLEGDSIPASSITPGTMQSGTYQMDIVVANQFRLKNNSWLVGRNTANTGDVSVIKVSDYWDRIEIGSGTNVGINGNPDARLHVWGDDSKQEFIVGDNCCVVNDSSVRGLFGNADGPSYLRFADDNYSYGYVGWWHNEADTPSDHLRIGAFHAANFAASASDFADIAIQPTGGNVLIGFDPMATAPNRHSAARLHVSRLKPGSDEQLRLEYDETHYASLTVDSAGVLAVSAPLKIDAITERTANSGVTIEGVLLKDGVITGGVVQGQTAFPNPGITTNLVGEYTANSGVMVDGVLLKDGKVGDVAVSDGTISLAPKASAPTSVTGAIYCASDGSYYVAVP